MAARLLPFLQAITLRRQTLKHFTCAAHIPGRVVTSSFLMAIMLVLPSAAVVPLTQVGGGLWRGRLKFLIPKTGRKGGETGWLVTQGGLTSVGKGCSDFDVLLRKREG